jgi:PhoD-like phosphatase
VAPRRSSGSAPRRLPGFSVRVDEDAVSTRSPPGPGAADRPLRVATAPDLERPVLIVWPAVKRLPHPYGAIRHYDVEGLVPGTTYYFGLAQSNGTATSAEAAASESGEPHKLLGSVTTFPAPDAHAEVHVGFGSCQRWTHRTDAFSRLTEVVPQASNHTAVLMLHLGDLHYGDIAVDDVQRFKDAMTAVVTSPGAAKLFSSMHVSYMYDDHDYAGNNGDASALSRNAAMTNYKNMVPVLARNSTHPSEKQLINYHAFSVASVRFIITDLRSEANKGAGVVMGPDQLKWFFSELVQAPRYSVVVWASTRPWIGKNSTKKDYWGAFPEQRAQIANFIAEHGIKNLILIAGDAHMLAADDGTNSDYSREGLPPAGFPVLQSAPFANYGSAKGGPFSEGCFATRLVANYHFSTLRIHGIGRSDGPCISYRGYSAHASDPVLKFDKCGALGGVDGVTGGGQASKCSIRLAPAWLIAVAVLLLFLAITLIAVAGILCARCRKSRSSKQ